MNKCRERRPSVKEPKWLQTLCVLRHQKSNGHRVPLTTRPLFSCSLGPLVSTSRKHNVKYPLLYLIWPHKIVGTATYVASDISTCMTAGRRSDGHAARSHTFAAFSLYD
ncbi:hypothetical protein BDW22DRAFT_1017153 [Trametopsis cervina]|nr:hypothetical protein BDW22DRAFT_1017153 [Trametopsis cervina]